MYKELAKKTGLPESELMIVMDNDLLHKKRDTLAATLNRLLLARQEEKHLHSSVEKKIQELQLEM